MSYAYPLSAMKRSIKPKIGVKLVHVSHGLFKERNVKDQGHKGQLVIRKMRYNFLREGHANFKLGRSMQFVECVDTL